MSLPDDARFVTLGMFIIDEFSYADADGKPTGKTRTPEVCFHPPHTQARPSLADSL